jgi:hypothetical protein
MRIRIASIVATVLDAVYHFASDVRHYGEEPPAWWWERSPRFEMWDANVNAGEYIGDVTSERSAFFFVLAGRIAAFFTQTVPCMFSQHVTDGEYFAETHCCERCGCYVSNWRSIR